MKQARPWPAFSVTAKAQHSLESGHPWVYDTEITAAPETLPAPGEIVDLGRYDTSTDTFTPVEGADIPENYAAAMMARVNDKFTYSARVLEQDYYGKLGLTDGWQEIYGPQPEGIPNKIFQDPALREEKQDGKE